MSSDSFIIEGISKTEKDKINSLSKPGEEVFIEDPNSDKIWRYRFSERTGRIEKSWYGTQDKKDEIKKKFDPKTLLPKLPSKPKMKIPKGIAGIIILLLKQMVKNTFRFEKAIDPLIEKLSQQCPPPAEMKKLLNTKNKISNGLTTAQTILGTQTKATTAVDSVVTKISQAKTALELGLVALPSAVLGVGIPVGAITGFSSILEMLGGMIDKNKGLAEQGLSSLKFISYQLSVVQTKLNSIDILINYCSKDLSEDELDELGIELTQTTDTSNNPKVNEDEGKKLLAQLSPNSNNPLFYKGFKLTLESNKDNTFSFPQRRVTAKNPTTNITLEGPWSYSSSTQILIEEIKFKIDQYLLSLEPSPTPIQEEIEEIETDIPTPPSITEPEVGVYWKYSDTATVYYELNGDITSFTDAVEYKIHRAMNGYPTDWSQIESRGKDPNYVPPSPDSSNPPSPTVKQYYTTKRSDQLDKIAKKYNTTPEQIIKWNPNLKYKNNRKERKGKLLKGQSILVGIKK